jgi:hypothetical protein
MATLYATEFSSDAFFISSSGADDMVLHLPFRKAKEPKDVNDPMIKSRLSMFFIMLSQDVCKQYFKYGFLSISKVCAKRKGELNVKTKNNSTQKVLRKTTWHLFDMFLFF